MPQNKNKKIIVVNVAVLILLITSFLARLVFANFAASQSYELSQYANDIKKLRTTHEQLTLAATELQSVERVKEESAVLNLVKVDSIYYVNPTGAVAINR